MAPSIEVLNPFDHFTTYYSQEIRRKYEFAEQERVSPFPSSADIGYHPHFSQYLTRSASIKHTVSAERNVPHGWPKSMTGPLAWTPESFPHEDDFVHMLSESEKSEIHQALEHFKVLKLPISRVVQDNFPLPTLGPCLGKAQDMIYSGSGIVVFRGLDADAYDDVDAATIFLGVSSYIAERRGKQDRRGSMISHVLSRYKGEKNDDKGTYEMPFHTDIVCDTLALFTRNCSATGGRGIIASSWTIFNELAKNRPDLIHVLAEPNWPLDTFGRDPSYRRQALLFHRDGKVILSASRRLLTGSPDTPRTRGIPGLSEEQAEALDAVHYIAKANSVEVSMRKGDMRFLNNMGLIHSREAVSDDSASQRHLLRLWLKNEGRLWKLPPALQLAWARVFEEDEREPVWDVSPVKLNNVLVNPAESCD